MRRWSKLGWRARTRRIGSILQNTPALKAATILAFICNRPASRMRERGIFARRPKAQLRGHWAYPPSVALGDVGSDGFVDLGALFHVRKMSGARDPGHEDVRGQAFGVGRWNDAVLLADDHRDRHLRRGER